MQNSASMKMSRNNKLPKGPVPLFALARKECNQMQCIYFVFCIFYSRTFTCIRSSKNLPGRVNCWISLKFTEKYYKKLSFSIETNPFHVLWFEKFRSLISRSRTTKRATLLYIQGIIVIDFCCVNIIFVRLLNTRIYLFLNQLVKKKFCLLACGNLSLPKSISLLSISPRTYTVLNINWVWRKTRRRADRFDIRSNSLEENWRQDTRRYLVANSAARRL